MEAIEKLLDWATARGVVLDGIGPKPLPGRGIGIVATRELKQGEAVLTVPTALLRSLDSTPKPIVRALKGATVHAILAAALCLESDPDFDVWRAVLPSPDDVEASMPICWPADLQALLPPAATSMLDKQQAKFDKDWTLVSAAFPDAASIAGADRLTRDSFLYAWNLVNSRTFYHTTPRTETRLPKDDHMVLQPVADLFNHSPHGSCAVSYDAAGFTIATTRAHAPGDELSIRYGAHSNDFLLVEYGFALPRDANPWDETGLDACVCPLFAPAQRRRLEDAGFWGGYVLDAQTACYRTQTALRMLCVTPGQWRAVLDGVRDEDVDAPAVDRELLRVLRKYEKDIRGKVAEIERSTAGSDDARHVLRARWIQIKELVVAAISRIQD
ncbi:SET domain-containing protein [Purpureocillium lilacinum]|uniref:SET domain-containing protein n=1 Tax=Purpureocillium lilacinum TaxID=33203 RepID=A0A179HXK8_PURLI|nr:SET domain-containing protein [Purpureocillium lilacinum]OAQ94281.1 SET domain-containing protein [Purpureocillium lilacinum]